MASTVLGECEKRGHEQVSYFYYPEVGLKAIVSIHDTTLGPALGGCRVRMYHDEQQALEDVMRLSEGMTYKSSLAGLPLGGGKSCIIADPAMKEGRKELFQKFGECLNFLMGRYVTAEDMGTCVDDMMAIRAKSRFVVGTDPLNGGAGDPSPWTARGVFLAMRAASERVFTDSPSLKGKKVSLQGVGHVGMYLLELLAAEGATVVVSDTNKNAIEEATRRFGVRAVAPDALYDEPCDIFAPCAIGQTVNPTTLARLKCRVIAGAANNQLSDPSVYSILESEGILYCPDFAINSGGVICVGAELAEGGPNKEWIKEKVEAIYSTTAQVLDESKLRGRFTEEVAIELAKERISAAKNRLNQ